MECGIIEVLLSAATLFLILYNYLTSKLGFWKKLNVKGPKALPFFGNFIKSFLGKKHFGAELKQYYDDYKSEPFVGLLGRSLPLLMMRDPDLIKDVLIKDFNAFSNRGDPIPSTNDPLNQNLFLLEYNRWRILRNKLTPVFSSSKLKDMFYLLVECAKQLENYVNRLVEKGEAIDCYELSAKYTTDCIAMCAFGLNTNALSDETSEFRKFGKDRMDSSWINIMRRILREYYPRVYKIINKFIFVQATSFFVKSIENTIKYRKMNNIKRNDFIDLLMELKYKQDKLTTMEFTDSLLTSQAFIFFIAGFETSAITVCNTLYELALNQDMQDKLRKEIKMIIKKEKAFTFENITKMNYLDKIVKETLRKYPPASTVYRISVAPYTFSGTNVTVPKDIKIVVPVYALHHDPEIYPNPEKFDPERFSDENVGIRHAMYYLPFGDGPRNCIGLRFSNYQMKLGLATLLNSFCFDVCDKTCTSYCYNPRSTVMLPLNGIYLKIKKL